jgi:hypothetical protein
MKRKNHATRHSKEMQPNQQAGKQLHHILFFHNTLAKKQMTVNFNSFENNHFDIK